MMITSLKNQLIKDTVKLYQKKERTKQQKFLIEGEHLYQEALKKGVVDTVFTTDTSLKGKNVIHVHGVVMEKLSAVKNNKGIVAICEIPKEQEVHGNVLILEHIQDPGNVGTLLRSAVAFGYNTVIIDESADVFSDKVVRSTQGAIFHLNIVHMKTTAFMDRYRQYHCYGTSLKGVPLKQLTLQHPHAIILGNEGSGVSDEVLYRSTENITIEMQDMESLNVAVAGSIIMYEIHKK